MAKKAKSRPLFTEAEEQDRKERMQALEKQYRGRETPFDTYWAERTALERAQLMEMVRRAQARADEFLNALLVLIARRGAQYVNFAAAFAESQGEELRKEVAAADTPENYRALYTILRALTEVPKSWAFSALARFLRGTGKQRGAKYHGAGTFGAAFGWKGDEVTAVCRVLADGHNPYSQVLMSYADVEEEARDEPDDVEVVDDEPPPFGATRVERDTEFLEKLCEMLEKRGLAEPPRAAPAKPKKERKPKVFKAGDIVRERNLRDLRLPALLRIPIEKKDQASGQWLPRA